MQTTRIQNLQALIKTRTLNLTVLIDQQNFTSLSKNIQEQRKLMFVLAVELAVAYCCHNEILL